MEFIRTSEGPEEDIRKSECPLWNINISQTDQKGTLKGLQNDLKRTYKDLEALSGP